MPGCEWEGSSYDRISGPQLSWGEEVLARLPLTGGETVLDAGCGSGRVTELLLERLPRGRVIGIDESESMIEAARRRLGERVRLERQDLLALSLGEPLDAVFSTATFHWIPDHPRLFENLRRALHDGGRLAAQAGGEGNLTRLRAAAAPVIAAEPFAAHLAGWQPPWNYPDERTTQSRLLAAGFAEATCWLAEAPVRLAQPREFLSTIIFGPHVQRLPERLREPFVDQLMARLGEDVVVDYVRLNIDALA